MTNEEKAIEICDKMGFHNEPFLRATYREDVEQAIEEGMQWKDEQMKEALNNILIECDACFDEQTTNTLESIIKHQISLL